jgi:hypothetical protein
MNMLIDFFLIVAVFVWLAELHAEGAVSVEHAAVSIVFLTLLLAVSRRSKWLRHFLEIAFVVALLLVFLILQRDGDLRAVGALLGPLLAVLIVLFGLYLIVFKAFGRPRDRRDE